MRQVVAVPQPGFCSRFLLSFRLFLLVAVVIIPKGTILGMVAGPPTSFVQDISIKAAEILMQDRTDDLHFSRLKLYPSLTIFFYYIFLYLYILLLSWTCLRFMLVSSGVLCCIVLYVLSCLGMLIRPVILFCTCP